ncbi:MAG: DNA double-strand break repair nuclease NurA [Ignavibacteriales bacterium]
MLEISQELKDCLVKASQKISKKYLHEMVKDKQIIRRMINLRIDKIQQISSKNAENLVEKYAQKGIVAVDSSIYSTGNSYPHYISIMQAKARSTNKKENEIIKAEVYSPLVEDNRNQNGGLSKQEKDEKSRLKKLARLEIKTAHEALKNMTASLIMANGPLTRYNDCSGEEWEAFTAKAMETNTIIIGIIENVNTDETAKRFKKLIPEQQENAYDREMLFGVLDKGEYFILKDWEDEGIKKCFVRMSNNPSVICVEYLEKQEEKLLEALSLLLAITPEDGAGIPLWLQIVNSEVCITEKLGKSLIETYFEPEIRYKMISSKEKKY